MEWNPIDMVYWPRAPHFHHYLQDIPCTYAITVQLDVTHLVSQTKKLDCPFYPAMIYGLAKVVNAHPEFRMSLDKDGNPGYYSVCHPSYTIFHQESETFSSLWTAYDSDFSRFLAAYQQDIAQYGQELSFAPKPDIPNIFSVSCLPWTSFTGFQLHLQKGWDYLLPIFTFGRYTPQGDRLTMPLAIQVHHSACDGFHVARFVEELEQWLSQGF